MERAEIEKLLSKAREHAEMLRDEMDDSTASLLDTLAYQCLALLDRAESAERDRDAARRQGAEEERGRVVAWLRSDAAPADWAVQIGGSEFTTSADAIERGDHMEAP
jgi:hypothetical protein